MEYFRKQLQNISCALGVLFLILTAVTVCLQIFTRAIGIQLLDGDLFAAYFMTASFFCALSFTQSAGAHIKVTLIESMLSKQAVRILCIFALILAIGTVAFALYSSLIFVRNSFVFNYISNGQLRIPMWIPELSMPIGLTLYMFELTYQMVNTIRGTAN